MWLVFGLVVLASSPPRYGKVPRLILKETNRLTQAVVFSRSHFLRGALFWICSSAEREGLSIYIQRECSAEPFIRSILNGYSHLSPVLANDFYRDANSVFLHVQARLLCTSVSCTGPYVRNCSGEPEGLSTHERKCLAKPSMRSTLCHEGSSHLSPVLAHDFVIAIQIQYLKKNQNASRPSEYPPVRGGQIVKTFRWDQRLQIQNLFMAFKRVPRLGSPMEITLGQQYNVGEKPTVILYTYINRHAGTPENSKNKTETI